MDQQIINLFDEYTHKPLSREVFFKRLATIVGGTAAALAILPLLEVNYARAATIPPDTDTLETGYITYKSSDGAEMRGYLAQPKEAAKRGGVVVIHENRGLNPHIEDVTRRAAMAGFIALAPDGLSSVGGTPADADQARELFGKLDGPKTVQQFAGAFEFLQAQPNCNGKFGAVGFCWGGAMANSLAVAVPNLLASVPFYGRQPAAEDVPKIKAALQLHYAEMDERVNAGIAAYEAALKAAGTRYELHMYAGVQHGFHNDTGPTRYNEAAAKLAWERTLAFLHSHLD